MTRVLKRAGRLVFQNFGWKLLSLAIAYAIWASVASEPELATSVSVRLEYKGLPEGIEISRVEPADNTVMLELRGPSGQLRTLGETEGFRPAVVIDMSGAQPGIRTFMIGGGNIRLPRGVRLVRATPSEARFEFERRVPRAVPVAARFTGDVEEGYELAHYDVAPDKLTIVGPRSHVDRVRDVVTDPVDLTGVVGTSQFHVNAYVGDSYVRLESPPEVTVTVTMKKK